MTTKKRATMGGRDDAGIAQADATIDREPAATPAPAPTEEAAETPAPAPKKPRVQRAKKTVKPQGVSEWPLIAARAHPDLHATWTTLVSSREIGQTGRDTMKVIMDEFLLGMDPFDEYTEELHRKDQEQQERARARATRRKRGS